ncbi:hypothetical protein HYE68_001805 [Fusarium pseudograminearum]|nr:hypothetical protein HYE68_001805 [Fusarium pseudograminearum]
MGCSDDAKLDEGVKFHCLEHPDILLPWNVTQTWADGNLPNAGFGVDHVPLSDTLCQDSLLPPRNSSSPCDTVGFY